MTDFINNQDIPSSSNSEADTLRKDLGVVMEKVRMCREMLQVSPGIHLDEILADVIGFLEACRDRMADIIEAGTQGLLDADLFEHCLKVNDAVLKTLDAERTGKPIDIDDEESAKKDKKVDNGNANLLGDAYPTPTPFDDFN